MHPLRPALARLLTSMAVMTLVAACDPGASTAPRAGAGLAEAASERVTESVVISPEAPDAPASRYRTAPRRGVVTAGDIDDTLNLAAFQSYLSRSAGKLGLPQAGFGTPVIAQLTGPTGEPAPGVRYTLRKPGAAGPFHDGYSGVDGRIVAFPALLGGGRLKQVELRAYSTAQQEETVRTIATGKPVAIALPAAPGWQPDFLDLVIVLDTTGTMGDELTWLTQELTGIIGAARQSAPGTEVRVGLVAYRDRGDDYVVQRTGFTGNLARMRGWLRRQTAEGGGDCPEAAAEALQTAVNFYWRPGKAERLIFHIADAPPHRNEASAYLGAAQKAADKGIQIYTLGASGVAAESEFLMRQAAAMTGGRYLFLTDDSGVGLDHAEPTISCYRVTLLRDLMVRILKSELTGRRIEAPSALREVGSYANGVCRS